MDALQKLTALERAVQGDRPVRRAAVLVVSHFCAIKIEVPVWLIPNLSCKRHHRRDLPIKPRAGSDLTIRDNSVVETWNSMRNSKLIFHTESGIPDSCSCIQRYISSQFVLQTRRWQNRVKQPWRRNSTAHAYGRKDRIFSFQIDPYAENELQVRAVKVSPDNDER